MSDTLPILYKLMTLYTLSRVDFALTNKQISNVFLDLGYTHYFNVQYTLGDLVESGMIREDVYPNCIYYSLTEEGLESLEALKNNISSGIRQDIDGYLKKNRLEFREAVSKKADYYRTAQDDFAVRERSSAETGRSTVRKSIPIFISPLPGPEGIRLPPAKEKKPAKQNRQIRSNSGIISEE